jgi:DNA polymerase I-like protein with 3'-5' exonuclease and polymerase domains
VHDELQYETTPEKVEHVKFSLEGCAKLAGEYYNLRIPIAAEAKSGSNWAEVH